MDRDNLISNEFLLEIQRLVSLKELQSDLLDDLGAAIMWILNYAKKTNTDVPNLDGLLYLPGRINKAMQIMYPDDSSWSSDESLQPSESDGELTAPNFLNCLQSLKFSRFIP